MRQRFTAAPGTSLRAISLPGEFTRGVEIDNPSGSWLYIPTLEIFIEPYTLGWSSSFPYDVSSVDIIARDGPAGQVSTSQGDGITVYLSSDPVGESAGSPDPGAAFIRGFTPVLFVANGEIVPVGALQVIPIAGVANRRIRLLTLDASLNATGPNADYHNVSPVSISVTDTLGTFISQIDLFPDSPQWHSVYSNGLDLTVGLGLRLVFTSQWTSTMVNWAATYQVI